MALPYLTQNIPGISGTIKNRAEDFFVQELPLYEPSGQGEHVYAEFQKVGLTTFDAIERIGRSLPQMPLPIVSSLPRSSSSSLMLFSGRWRNASIYCGEKAS